MDYPKLVTDMNQRSRKLTEHQISKMQHPGISYSSCRKPEKILNEVMVEHGSREAVLNRIQDKDYSTLPIKYHASKKRVKYLNE